MCTAIWGRTNLGRGPVAVKHVVLWVYVDGLGEKVDGLRVIPSREGRIALRLRTDHLTDSAAGSAASHILISRISYLELVGRHGFGVWVGVLAEEQLLLL